MGNRVVFGKVLLIDVPAVKLEMCGNCLDDVKTNYPKISQLVVAAIIKREFPKVEIRIVDMKSAAPCNEVKFKEIDYGGNKIDVYRVGQDFSAIESSVKWADVLIFTNNFTQEAGVVGDLIEFCKGVNSRAKVFVGGSDAMVKRGGVDRQAYFYSRGADRVASGDGEITLAKLFCGQAVVGSPILPDLNSVPLPSFDLVDLSLYTESYEGVVLDCMNPPLMYLETSRGCRGSCDFCSTPFTKGKYRFMSQNKIEEVLTYYKSAGISTVLLCEENILTRLDWPGGRNLVLSWFDFMRDNGFRWEFTNGVEIGRLMDSERLDETLIEALFAFNDLTGCCRTYVPFERLDRLVYRKLKPFETEKEILASIARQGVPALNLGVIIGHPLETQESLDITERRLKELMDLVLLESKGKSLPYAALLLHIPLPGTRDYTRFCREGRLAFDINKDPELFSIITSVVNGNVFSCYEMTKIRKEMALRLNSKLALRV